MINPASGELITEFGPLASAEVILLDEINRIPLKSQSAFLEGLQDRTVTVGKTTYELPAFSFAIATMNPVELGQGTFPLSEAATDRFAVMINVGYLPPEEEAKLVNFDFKHVRLNALMSKERIIALRSTINERGVPARAPRHLHPAAGRRHPSLQRRHRLAAPFDLGAGRARRRSGRLAPGDHRAGAGWPRCGRCWCAAATRSTPRTSRTWRRTS